MQWLKQLVAIIVAFTLFVSALIFIPPTNQHNKLYHSLIPTAQAATDDNKNDGNSSDNQSREAEKQEIDQKTGGQQEANQSQKVRAQELIKKSQDGDLNESEKEELHDYERANIIKKDKGDKYSLGSAASAEDGLWTLYANILMQKSKKEEKKDNKKKENNSQGVTGRITGAIKNSIGDFMGDGGVEVTVPFNKMYSIGVDLDEDNGKKSNDGEGNTQVGRQLASFFSTFSHYGYIQTVSGNTLASHASGGLQTIMRHILGFFMVISMLVYEMFNFILGNLVTFIGKLDFWSLMGYEDANEYAESTKNPIIKGIYGFIQGLGISANMFHRAMLLGFFIAVAIFVYRLMRTISGRGFHWGALSDATKRFIVRFLTFWLVPSAIILLVGGFAKQLDNIQTDPKYNPSPPSQYLLNDRKWASALNLSPTGMKSGESPNASSDTQHVDSSYAPSASRDLIGQINAESYKRMNGDVSSKDIGFDLIAGYMDNTKFNVNTYMADIRQTPKNTDSDNAADMYAAYKGYKELDEKKIKPQNYEDYIWTAKPVTSGEKDEAKPDNKKYKPNLAAGVEDNKSFSTQSVALMLQTSFEDNAANFYAYNIPPSGVQGAAKNMSTVKTEWRAYTMPGEGGLGVIGSYLALLSQCLFQTFLIGAVIHALIFTNFWKSFLMTFKHWWYGIITGNPVHMLIALVLGLTSPLTGFIAYLLPSLFVTFVNTLVKGIRGVIDAFGVQGIDGAVDIGKAIMMFLLTIYLIIAKTFTGKNIITTIIDFLPRMGLDLANKAARIMRTRQQMRTAIRMAGQAARETGQTAGQYQSQGGLGNTTLGQTGKTLGNPSSWGQQGAAYLGNKQMNAQDASNKSGGSTGQTAKDFATMAGGATGRRGTAPNTLLGKTNPNQSAQPRNTNRFAKNDYFAGHNNNAPANATAKSDAVNSKQSKQPVQDKEAANLNKRYSQSASQLPSAMKQGSAKDFAKQINEEQAKQVKEAQKEGANDAKSNFKDTKNMSATQKEQTQQPPQGNTISGQGNRETINRQSAKDFAANEPVFNDNEIKNLNRSRNVDDFQEKLYTTRNGQKTALSQEPAKTALQGTEFINQDGNVDYNKIDEFNRDINGKHLEQLDDIRMRQKEQVDYAFRQGAESIYNDYEQKERQERK